MLALRLLGERYRYTEARCYLFRFCEPLRDFRKDLSISQDRSFVWKIYWKQLVWPYTLSEARSQEITKV